VEWLLNVRHRLVAAFQKVLLRTTKIKNYSNIYAFVLAGSYGLKFCSLLVTFVFNFEKSAAKIAIVFSQNGIVL